MGDRVEYKYNRLGQAIWTKDHNETVHDYAFDGVGWQTADMVTLPQGSAIDDGVLRIEHGGSEVLTLDSRGNQSEDSRPSLEPVNLRRLIRPA